MKYVVGQSVCYFEIFRFESMFFSLFVCMLACSKSQFWSMTSHTIAYLFNFYFNQNISKYVGQSVCYFEVLISKYVGLFLCMFLERSRS